MLWYVPLIQLFQWKHLINFYPFIFVGCSQPFTTHFYPCLPFFKGVSHDALNGVPGHFWAQCSTLSWPMRISYSWEYVKLINLHAISGISYDFIWFHMISWYFTWTMPLDLFICSALRWRGNSYGWAAKLACHECALSTASRTWANLRRLPS